MQTSLNIARPGGAIGRVGVPHDVNIPAAAPTFFKNLTISGGPAPSRAYFDEAYLTKYGRYPQWVAPMVTPEVRAATIKLVPLEGEN
jgi:threonine dehydrogenase-like Zn-dependent dehydrogenase